MLKIYDGRAHFWQWDINQRLKVDAGHACEVHFRDPDGTTALVVDTYTIDGQTVANVPNVLLQDDRPVLAWVYICEGDECTKHEARFEVWPRQKPADYVYTETETKSYEALEKRIDEIEKTGVSEESVSKAVKKYLDENPIDALPPVTEADDGKVLTVAGGKWETKTLPLYNGAYSVTPSAAGAQTMRTAGKLMDADITVQKIPYFETSNTSDGVTVIIGSEV